MAHIDQRRCPWCGVYGPNPTKTRQRIEQAMGPRRTMEEVLRDARELERIFDEQRGSPGRGREERERG